MEEKFEVNAEDVALESATFKESAKRSQAVWEDLPRNPAKYRVLTGERPTGPLHIGHLFGTVANRVRIQNLGATTFIVIADYQVLTDRDTADAVGANVHEAILDYLAVGLDPENGRTFFFSHSHVPELNQLLLPFMSLVTTARARSQPDGQGGDPGGRPAPGERADVHVSDPPGRRHPVLQGQRRPCRAATSSRTSS